MFEGRDSFDVGDSSPPASVADEWGVPGVAFQPSVRHGHAQSDGSASSSDAAPSNEPVLEGELAAAFMTINTVLDAVTAGVGAVPEPQVHAALVAVDRLANRVEATRVVIVRESIARAPMTRSGKRSTKSTKGVSLDRCRRGGRATGADVRYSELVDPDTGMFRLLGAAFGSGEVLRAHVAVAERLVSRVPGQVLAASRDAIDQILTDAAKQLSPDALAKMLDALVIRLNPDGGRDPDASQRRYLSLSADAYGMLQIRGQLDEAAGLLVQSVLDQLVAVDRSGHDVVDEEGQPVAGVTEVRSRGQRYADALTSAALGGRAPRADSRPRLTPASAGRARWGVEPAASPVGPARGGQPARCH